MMTPLKSRRVFTEARQQLRALNNYLILTSTPIACARRKKASRFLLVMENRDSYQGIALAMP
jgi:hypothetical protein